MDRVLFRDAEQSRNRYPSQCLGAFPTIRKLYPASGAFLGAGNFGTGRSGVVDLGWRTDIAAGPDKINISGVDS